jgi:hypothetical protein
VQPTGNYSSLSLFVFSFFLSTNEVLVSSRRTLILIAAIGVGLFAGLALLNYVRGIEDDLYADAQPVLVLIASEDIPEGTPAALALEMMVPQDVPLEIRPATFVPVNDAEQITGLVSRGLIPKNQIIVQGLFVDPAIVSARFVDLDPSVPDARSCRSDRLSKSQVAKDRANSGRHRYGFTECPKHPCRRHHHAATPRGRFAAAASNRSELHIIGCSPRFSCARSARDSDPADRHSWPPR